MYFSRFFQGFFLFVALITSAVKAGEWQWSVPVDAEKHSRAFLWIPPDCRQVRAVVFSQHNMIEEGILQRPQFRETMKKLGFGEVFVAPNFDFPFDFNHGMGEKFEAMMKALAKESGYTELEFVPVVPMGHSASASLPWNFAAWNPGRTLAVLSVHGDAPLTPLTGSGRPNPDWGNRSIDGIPGLMVMGEYEWWEKRLTPAFDFVAKHPATPLAFLGDAGHGHFDYSDSLVSFLCLFLTKSAEARLPEKMPLNGPVALKPVDPKKGWRIDRWRKDQPPAAPAAPYEEYTGNPAEAFWCFDGEMAKREESIYAAVRGKKPQLLSVTAGDMPKVKGCGEPVDPPFIPLADGLSFKIKTDFMDVVPGEANNGNPARWAALPVGTPLGHAKGPIILSRITGPVVQVGADTFRIQFNRFSIPADRRVGDMWLLASHPGDEEYKSMLQQFAVHIPYMLKEGDDQKITFPEIPDQKQGIDFVKLEAVSDAKVPVYYYVREGPAEVEGDALKILPIPPRSRFPVKVTVVAWQWGRSTEPKLKSAEMVERTFNIIQ